jgi:hypothetical protein
MGSHNELRQKAEELAADFANEASHLERERARLQRELAGIETRIETAHQGRHRVDNFSPVVDGQQQCPICWVRDERASALEPIGGGTDAVDLFRCRECRNEFELTT